MTLVATKQTKNWMSSIFDEFLNSTKFLDFESTISAVNIKEEKKSFNLEIAVPGKKKNDFKIELNHDLLTVFAESKEEDSKTEANYTRKEFNYSSFRRSFTLPETIDGDKTKAVYEDGVLKLTLPKKIEALPKPKKIININ